MSINYEVTSRHVIVTFADITPAEKSKIIELFGSKETIVLEFFESRVARLTAHSFEREYILTTILNEFGEDYI